MNMVMTNRHRKQLITRRSSSRSMKHGLQGHGHRSRSGTVAQPETSGVGPGSLLPTKTARIGMN